MAGQRATRETPHGLARYQNRRLACRCDVCTEAKRVANVANRERRRKLTAANNGIAPIGKHGTVTGRKDWFCKCTPCGEAAAAYAADRKAGDREALLIAAGAP